jgi:hypothetical protein
MLRREVHDGSAVGTLSPGTTGSTSRDGIFRECAIAIRAPAPCANWKAQIGWSPLTAEIVIRIREPAR